MQEPYAHVEILHYGNLQTFEGPLERVERYIDWDTHQLTLTWRFDALTRDFADRVRPLDMPDMGEFYD